jgi:hypothetical protein
MRPRSVKGRSVFCELWSINRWLRYTGFRLFVGFPGEGEPPGPTIIGLVFWGWKDWH